MLCLLAAVCVLSAIVLLIALVRSDGDLRLMFQARYGKKIDSLRGKVVWITGASSGIGEFIAYSLAEAGARLVLSARRKEELERVKQKCLQLGAGQISEGDILVLPLDVVAFDTHKSAVQKVLEVFNKIDILVNNAGRGQQAGWLDVDLNVDREIFEINVLGPISLTQQVLPHMIQRKQGHIVVVSSVLGKLAIPFSRSYVASKHAIHGVFESLRTEMGEHNIDVTLVCPGPVVSNIGMTSLTGKPGEILKASGAKLGMKRMSTARCAHLTNIAIANKLYEAWITENPPLLLLYVSQYFPDVTLWVAKTFGGKLVQRMRQSQQ